MSKTTCARGCALGSLLVFLAAGVATAQTPQTVRLWPDGAPAAVGEDSKDKPTLIVYLPEHRSAAGTAVVVCPGGGYGGLAMGHEGHEIAAWWNSLGIAAFICDYRHRGKGYGHPAPLQDVQRAIRMVRSGCEDWGVDPKRIGVMGFSAGGHLASSAATHFDAGDATSSDPIQRVSCRPDFAVLCYAVIALGEPFTHSGSQRNLLGADADPKLVREMSNEKQVSAETPPTFLWHTQEDRVVPSENSVQFYLACCRENVPAELHIFTSGRHGVGLARDLPGTCQWPELLQAWLRGRDLLVEPSPGDEAVREK